MEAQSLDDILDIVKKILKTSPSVARDTSTILPRNIQTLPKWSSNLPEGAVPLQRSIERLSNDVLPYLNASSLSSRFYGLVTGGVTPAALIADILTSVFDQNVSVHMPNETIATVVEVAALNMLLDLLNLATPEWEIGTSGSGGGTFTTGATASNVLGLTLGREFVLREASRKATGQAMSVGEHGILAVARAAQVDYIKILSTLPHSSTVKAASLVGIGRSSVIPIVKAGSDLAIDVELLQSLAEDAEAERTVYILAISAGEVNTGHFASSSAAMMKQVRDICDKYGIWIHVDGAFGLFARMLIGHNRANEFAGIVDGVQGLEVADSITADGHKLLNVPYDCGIFFTRHKELSTDTCTNGNAAYLKSGSGAATIPNPLNIGIENSRRFRALPVYHTLSAYGRDGYSDMLIRQITLSRRIAAWLWDHESYQVLPLSKNKDQSIASTFMIVIFRAKDATLNLDLTQKIKDSGEMYVSGTSWEGRPATRIAVSNWRVDVDKDFPVVEKVLSGVVQ